MSRVLLFSANTERLEAAVVPLGAAEVVAAARAAGHEARLVDLMSAKDPAAVVSASIVEFQPDVVGVSVRNIDDQDMQGPTLLLEKVRPVMAAVRASCGAPVVLGGAGFSMFPRATLDFLEADFGVVGPGEEAFPRLLARLDDPSGIPGVVVRGAAPVPPVFPLDLDAFPPPGDDLLPSLSPEGWVPVDTRRGCPNACVYCATCNIQGRITGNRSIHSLVRRIERYISVGFRRFWFVDNTFNQPASYAMRVCRALAPLGVTWRCTLYPDRVEPDLARAMADAGCVEVSVGFESGDDRMLRNLGKHFTAADARVVLQNLAHAGIRRMGFLLLGGPGETRESVKTSLAFAEDLHLEGLRTTVGLRIYPGTPLADLARSEGVITPDDDLLHPRFYLAPAVAPWILERVTPGIR